MKDTLASKPASLYAVLRCDDASAATLAVLRARIAGLPLLQRHFLSFLQAGVRDVVLTVPTAILHEAEQLAHDYLPRGMAVTVVASGHDAAVVRPSPIPSAPVRLEQSLDTLVDPRLVAQLARLARSGPSGDVICADVPAGDEIEAKSPYKVGVADADEAKAASPAQVPWLLPIGLALRMGGPGATPASATDGAPAVVPASDTVLWVGRYYWHRVRAGEDGRMATWKVLLATMKPTDGIYARTNRRLSLRISRLLLHTPVTANMVTMVTLVCGVLGGWWLAHGDYEAIVAGSMLAWFASMLDGVDGELARAKFQATALGHWLEMLCDYAFYISVATGLGAGFSRTTGQGIWLVLGVAAATGVVFSFLAVARLKRDYARRGSVNDFYLAYQQSVASPATSPFMRMTPHLTALLTRAAFPYYLVLFALLGLGKVALVLLVVATQSFWIGAVVVSRMAVVEGRQS